MASVLNQLKKQLNKTYIGAKKSLYRAFEDMGFFYAPISCVAKNYGFMFDTISRNIGSGYHSYDGFGTPIGQLGEVEYNMYYGMPWFYDDDDKNISEDYLDYINSVYFNGEGIIANVLDDKTKAAYFDYNSLLLDENHVGSVSVYDIDDNLTPQSLEGSDMTNPNGMNDTRLGIINNFYLNATLQNARNVYGDTLPYSQPSYGDKSLLVKEGHGITQGVYSVFGMDGQFGIKEGANHVISGRVRTQDELFGQIIPWSTADHTYDSYSVNGNSDNLSLVKNILNDHGADVQLDFDDLVKEGGMTHKYYPFGNFYSITYSLGLTSVSGYKTQEFIAKSMFGYDLLDDKHTLEDVNFDYTEGDASRHTKITGKKYFAGEGTRGSNYIDKLTGNDVDFTKDIDDVTILRIKPIDIGNDNLWSSHYLYEYAEAEGNSTGSPITSEYLTANEGIEFGKIKAYTTDVTSTKEDIIDYTNKRFLNNKFDTIIARFHTTNIGTKGQAREYRDMISTAISQYGMSHGRNLLKKVPTNENGYDNPYCRVWTYHHQYHTLMDTIRPFDVEGGNDNLELSDIGKTRPGQRHLGKYGVRGSNGLVRFAPVTNDGSMNDIRGCMFSLENLAWKYEKSNGSFGKESVGPNGGRIMWFPPYDLKFSENVNVNWNSTAFIGRGEQIYTYTNTDRGGQLSFKILIDHPNVVNMYRGDIRNAVEGAMCDGIGDVDDINSNEQTLLRFFAGCDILTGGTRTEIERPKENTKPTNPIQPNNDEPNVVEDSPSEEVKVEDPQPPAETVPPSLHFYVFYPNNYSGVDDKADGEVRPMEYLINGIGAQKETTDDSTEINAYKNIKDVPTTVLATYGSGVGGYEMRNVGVSLSEWTDKKKYKIARLGNYNFICDRDENWSDGKTHYWGHRVDKHTDSSHKTIHGKQASVSNEVMYIPQGQSNNVHNYLDYSSHQLNSKGYTSLLTYHKEAIEWSEKESLFSFTDVFCALQPEAKGILSGLYTEDKVNKITAMFNEYEVKSVNVAGMASTHGYGKTNENLSKQRADSVINWLVKVNDKITRGKCNVDRTETSGEAYKHHDNNKLDAKVWRCARCTIEFENKAITNPIEATENEIEEQIVIQDGEPIYGIDNINVGPHNLEYHDDETQGAINSARELPRANVSLTSITDTNSIYSAVYGKELTKVQADSLKNGIENNQAMATRIAEEANASGNTNNPSTRYEGYSEYMYFSQLEKTDPFLHSKLVHKLKYFDPAFHSITPEGFNARLTFLHQCTRQGSTYSASDDNSGSTARNLAFGAPPICVLRIGDFFNTKIIIENISIDYNDSTWDLNDEGIGVMPMMANVSLSFKFLGGSDLYKPIARLQNAVSFNYYANTSVYDDRADLNKENEND